MTSRYRLPRTVLPSHYDLTLEPDLAAANFRGRMAVQVVVDGTVGEIVLNALELEIDEAWLAQEDGTRLNASPSFDSETERCHLVLSGHAGPGAWTLHCRFRGTLNDKLHGFYRSTLKDENGIEHVIATTQMESTYARLAFPCWDEPDIKATFAVTLVVPDGKLVISNGAEIGREDTGDGRTRVAFAPTMKMSTYLVAFVVGPLGITDPVDAGGTPLRVAYPPGWGGLTGFALESGSFALEYFSDYYGIGYPADKLDLVAIPDFASGAMENLGCITFRETALLVDPERATQPELQRVADVVHHEIAHMWFGDLVTMRWWNGLWLNEAFATFMEMKCTDAFRPAWERWVDFGNSRTAAFAVDSLESTRPIEYEVVSPKDSAGMFDILTYEKGAAVLRMLEQYLGEDHFRDGVRHYLKAHAYGNTETTDLWDSLEEVTGHPVRRIMDGWIFRGGYPLVAARLDGGEEDPELRLEQRRFRYQAVESADDECWSIPLLIRYGTPGRERVEKLLLDGPTGVFPLAFRPDWMTVNAGANGFFRVHYTDELMEALLGPGLAELDAAERYGLVDDQFAALVAGRISAEDFLGLLERFRDETDLSVWQRICSALGGLERLISEPARAAFRAAVCELVRPAQERLGWAPAEGESERAAQLRGLLVETLGSLGGDPDTVLRCRELHADFVADRTAVDPALAAAAIGVIADTGDGADFDAFWRRHQEAPSPQLKIRYLHSLGRFRDPALTDRLLELVLTEVRSQDGPFTLVRALANPATGRRVWDFVAGRWEDLIARFPDNSIVRMVSSIAGITERDWAEEVEAFFSTHSVPQGERTLAQNLERMENTVRLAEREAERFADHLQSRRA